MRVRVRGNGKGEVKGTMNTRREVGKEWRRYLGGRTQNDQLICSASW